MILLIGSPCSGKSTIGGKLAKQLKRRFIKLDTFIQKKAKQKRIPEGAILTNEFIDKSVEDFFEALYLDYSNETHSIFELPYHDYSNLLNKYPLLFQIQLIALEAPLSTLLSRNKKRRRIQQIPESYIVRCHHSLEELKTVKNLNLIFYDTKKSSAGEIVKEIILNYEGLPDEK